MVGFVIALILMCIAGVIGGIGSSSIGVGNKASSFSSSKKKHSGRCDGDCANCPPHYGYRHGRWYYGHSHTEGCTFGGNKGDGGRD